MKKSLVVAAAAMFAVLGVPSLRAQQMEGCGNDATQFKVAHAKHEDPGAPKAGMAQLVLIQKKDGPFNGEPISRFSLDGQWVGADKGTSYFVVDLQPGHHLVCASRQTSTRGDKIDKLLKLDVVAGQTYYVEFHVQRIEIGDAEVSHAGLNGAIAPAGKGYTPDMTARQKDTMDAGDLTEIAPGEGMAAMHKTPVSIATAK